MPDKQYWVDFETMVNFMIDVFKGVGVPEEEQKSVPMFLLPLIKRH